MQPVGFGAHAAPGKACSHQRNGVTDGPVLPLSGRMRLAAGPGRVTL